MARIAVGGFQHETNTFAPSKADYAAFESGGGWPPLSFGDDIVARLTAVRGVGRWTVEMFLIFTLGRPDVWPVDDLGVRKGAGLLFDATYTPKTLLAAGEPFRPWRSALAWHCWRAVDGGK